MPKAPGPLGNLYVYIRLHNASILDPGLGKGLITGGDPSKTFGPYAP